MNQKQADKLVSMAKESKDSERLAVLIEIILNCLADLDDRIKILEDKIDAMDKIDNE